MERKALAGRDFIETIDWSVEEIEEALTLAAELKEQFRRGKPHRLLPDKTLFMLFLDKSTRTRNAFEAGMTQLGGHAHYLDAEKTQVAHGESPKDMGVILSRYGHGIAVRHDLIPTILDMPPVVSELIEEPEPGVPFGAKGVGEPSTIVAPAAIAAALRDATGHGLNRIPVKPDDLVGLNGPVGARQPWPASPEVPGPKPIPEYVGLGAGQQELGGEGGKG